jgi:hypothetical protein
LSCWKGAVSIAGVRHPRDFAAQTRTDGQHAAVMRWWSRTAPRIVKRGAPPITAPGASGASHSSGPCTAMPSWPKAKARSSHLRALARDSTART